MKKLIKSLLSPEILFLIKKFFFRSTDELYVIQKYFRRNNISKGLMIDVGVHYGSSCIPFLKDGWKVYGFEPDLRNLAEATKRIPREADIKIFDYALSDEPGEMEFFSSNVSSGISSLSNFHESHKLARLVQVKTLGMMIENLKIQTINLLKIDAEGFDLKVLKGINFSDKLNLDIIICEFEDKKTLRLNYSVLDTIAFLEHEGYKVIVCEWEPIREYGINHRFKKAKLYPCDIDAESWGNLIAFKDPAFSNFALKELNF